jgi:hypothetical protein
VKLRIEIDLDHPVFDEDPEVNDSCDAPTEISIIMERMLDELPCPIQGATWQSKLYHPEAGIVGKAELYSPAEEAIPERDQAQEAVTFNTLETLQALTFAVAEFNRWHPSGELEGLIDMGKQAIGRAKAQADAEQELREACKTVLAGFRYEKGRSVMAEWKMKETLEKALARYPG